MLKGEVFRGLASATISLFLFLLVLNNYVGNSKTPISGDGYGYYDYLPSIFIHNDLYRKDISKDSGSSKYKRFKTIYSAYVDHGDRKVNKYPVGTAVLMSPFFLVAHYVNNPGHESQIGLETRYQRAMFQSALFYLFLALVFTHLLITLFGVRFWVSLVIQVLMVLATPVIIYASEDASYSHVYSLFAISAFLYFGKAYFVRRKIKYFLWACGFLGLIVLIRQVNIMVLFALPFLAGSWEELLIGVKGVFKRRLELGAGVLLVGGIAFVQCLVWYAQTGDFILYSYRDEGFNFSRPELLNLWFSYRKGLFVYTPVLLLSIIGALRFAWRKEFYLFISWLGLFLVISYIFSSWWCWWYGCTYGQRVYIDYLSFLFIPLALMLNSGTRIVNLGFVLGAFLCIPLNAIQAYQNTSYILHCGEMDKESYWRFFLRTEDRFGGILWKPDITEDWFTKVEDLLVGDVHVNAGETIQICQFDSLQFKEPKRVHYIQPTFEFAFPETEKGKLRLVVDRLSSETNSVWEDRPLLHFVEADFGQDQSGKFSFTFNPKESGYYRLKVFITARDSSLELKDFRVKFLQQNWDPE